MLIKIRKASDVGASEITPKSVYLDRRRFLRAAAVAGAGAAMGGHRTCHPIVIEGTKSASRLGVRAPQAARDDVRKPRNAALRVAFPVPSGRREGFPMAPHRLRLPSYRGNGKSDRMGAL